MRKFVLGLFLGVCICSVAFAENQKDIDQQNDQAELLLNQNPKQSLDLAARNKLAAEKLNYKLGVAHATALMGVANYKVDEFGKAKILITESGNLSAQLKDTSGIAFSKYWLGNLELNQGRYSNALDFYQTANALAEKTGDKKNIARSLDGKASIYEALGEDKKALELYQQSLATAKQINFKAWYPGITFSLGNLAYAKGKLDEAIEKYKEAITISDETGNLNNKASCYQQLASIYYDRKDTKQAMEYIEKAMDLFDQTGQASNYSRSRVLMSSILASEGEYKAAISLAKSSLEEGKKTKETQLQQSAAEVLYYVYMRKGDKKEALDYHILLHDLSEANHNEDLAKKLAQIDLESNFAKEREIAKAQEAKHEAEMNAQIDRQNLIRKVSLVLIFMVSIIAGLAIFAFLQKRRDNSMIAKEKQRTDGLLMNILPEEIVSELRSSGYAAGNQATVLFADIRSIGGSAHEKPSAAFMQAQLDYYFKTFDEIVAQHKIEKIKTIGDAYLCVGALEVKDRDNAINTLNAALEMQQFVDKARKSKGTDEVYVEISIGIHTGPLIAGIIGIRKFSYDVWGDTVNVAARMEQHGEEGKINISGSTFELIKDKFACQYNGKIEVKNKQQLDMYYVTGVIA